MNADGHKQGRAAGAKTTKRPNPWLFRLDASAGGGVFHHQAKLAQSITNGIGHGPVFRGARFSTSSNKGFGSLGRVVAGVTSALSSKRNDFDRQLRLLLGEFDAQNVHRTLDKPPRH